ncbi:MAG: hypothetical protein ACXIUD_06765 [Mongoliitalea sp.]
MVDDLKFEIPFDPPLEFREKVSYPFEHVGLIFSPEFNRNGDVIHYAAQLKNLFIKMTASKLIVMNSWHKFYKGNNYSEFIWDELQECMRVLEGYFGEYFWDSRITKMTVGLNFNCDVAKFVDSLISYKGKPMEPMRPRDSRKIYGKRFVSSYFNLKVYDKQFEVLKDNRIHIPPTLRVEKEMKLTYFQKRKQNPILIFSPRDLKEPTVLDYIRFELQETIFSFGFDYGIDPMMTKDFKDASVVIFMSNPEFQKVLKKKSNYRTSKSYEARMEELRSEFEFENLREILIGMVEEKIKGYEECLWH